MKRQRMTSIALQYAQCSTEQTQSLAQERLARDPRCAVTRYVLGCHCFDRGSTALAVRHLMIAHHAEPTLESAALLAFAGLNWVGTRGSALLGVLLDTWDEFRRPEFDRRPLERAVLDAFAEPDPGLDRVTPLARRLWRLPIRTLRAQIRAAVVSRDTSRYPLLTTPA
jgi:hypothetical protein